MAPADSVSGESVGRQAVGGDPARFQTLVTDVADRFGLGASAGPLVREVLNIITGTPGGVAGFLAKFEAAGLGPELSSWLGRRDSPSMSQQLLDRMVGPAAVEGMANRLGLSTSSTSAAVAYLLPKMVGALTPGGTVPGTAASESSLARRAGEHDTARASSASTTRGGEQAASRQVAAIPDEPHMMRWLWPLLGLLVILGLASYLFTSNRPSTPPVAARPPAPPPPQAPALPSHLALSNENGTIRISGGVHDQETRNAILNALKAVYGADRVQGDIAVDPNRGAAPWLVNLRTALETLKAPGVQAVFDGNAVNLGGILSEADRDRIVGSLRNALGSGLVYGALTDRAAGLAGDANASVMAALSALKPGFTGTDLVAVLNRSIINFPNAGSEVPSAAMTLLHSAAQQIKQLPPGTVLEIAGYTDNVGDPAANVKLSQQRADAVRNALVQAGVDPSKLVSKGYGSANPIASNDLLEGRFRNRRIEYHVLKQ